MKVKANTIEELFSASREHESDLRELDKLIVKTAPKLKRQLFSGPSITMIGYGEMTWMNKSSSGVWPLISVAPQKGTISIYVAAESAPPLRGPSGRSTQTAAQPPCLTLEKP